MGIDDEEMPVTVDDRAINIIPMGDDDSVAGRMEPRYFKMNRQMLQQSFKTLKALRVREARHSRRSESSEQDTPEKS
jgi:hypothetical protein